MTEIEKVLDERIRPVLAQHNGNIRVIELAEDGTLYLQMMGQCSQCAAAKYENEDFFETEITSRVPEVRKVVLEDVVNQELLDFAKGILNKHADSN